ncbi:MAG: hypothetical protein AAGH60_10810 [Pseudomonadota bacterium]
MKDLSLSTLAAIVLASTAVLAFPAQASNNNHQVQCADGTVYVLNGDEITDDVACANHGGVSTAAVIIGGTQVQTNHGKPPEPLKVRPLRATR